MNILYIVESAATGVARHLLDLIDGVRAAGHRVAVIYSPAREDGIFRAGRERLSRDGIDFHAVPMRRAPGPWDWGPCWRRGAISPRRDRSTLFMAIRRKAA